MFLSDLSNSSASSSDNFNSNTSKHDSNNSTHASYGQFTTFAPLHDINISSTDVLLENVSVFAPDTNTSSESYNYASSTSFTEVSDEITEISGKFSDVTANNLQFISTASSSSTEDLNLIGNSSTESPVASNTTLVYSTTIDKNSYTTESSIDLSTTSGLVNITDSNLEQDVIKIEKDDIPPPENLELPRDKRVLSESHSMKPTELEGPEVLQHDYPLYAYGQEEVEIIKLNREPFSTTMKSKAAYNRSVGLEDTIIRLNNDSSDELTESNLSTAVNNENNVLKTATLNNDSKLKMHDLGGNNNYTNISSVNVPESPKEPNIKLLEVPPMNITGMSPSKRVLVNVTIATDPDSSNPLASQSIYVLSVSIPTNGDPNLTPDVTVNPQQQIQPANLIKTPEKESSITNNNNDTAVVPGKEKAHDYWGGQCQCSCPCLDESNFAENETAEDDELKDENNILSSQNVNFTTPFDETAAQNLSSTITVFDDTSQTEATTTEDVWRTETACPEITTKLPPPPTILILEGRAVSF